MAVSAVDGTGMPRLCAVLDEVLAAVPAPSPTDRVRLWVDRSFTITGAGTVVTGTLAAGTVTDRDRLELIGAGPAQTVVVRGLESCGQPRVAIGPVTRAAVNLRGVPADSVRRGDALLIPGAWWITGTVDVRRVGGAGFSTAPQRLTVHVGTAAVPGRLRPFDDDHARVLLDRRLPLALGDRLVLRHPGSRRVLGGAQVLDADPPQLRRRGDGTRRTAALAGMDPHGDLLTELARRGAVTREQLQRLGFHPGAKPPDGVLALHGWWVHVETFQAWQQRLQTAVQDLYARDPLANGLSHGAACDLAALPDPALLEAVIRAAGLRHRGGRIRLPGGSDDLGPAEAAVSELVDRLQANPFRAPEAAELAALQLGVRELAAAERAGRVLRLADGVVLLPSAPALAMRELSRLDQPFTTSTARFAIYAPFAVRRNRAPGPPSRYSRRAPLASASSCAM